MINVLHLQTLRDGGILDPDDFIQDVVEDKELLIAIYEEIDYNNLLLKTEHINNKLNMSNSLNNSSLSTTSSTSTNCSHSAAISSSTTTNNTGSGSFILNINHKQADLNQQDKSNTLFNDKSSFGNNNNNNNKTSSYQLNTSNCQNTFQIENRSIIGKFG